MSRQRFSRRYILGNIFGVVALPFASPASTLVAKEASATDLPAGIEVVDFRLFESDGVTRFLVEVHNSTNQAVDTPVLGVILPHLDSDVNYGWAVPIQEVLHANASAGLIGVAPKGIEHDDNWGDPQWILCNEIETVKAEKLSAWDVEFDYSLRVLGDNDVVADILVTNHGKPLPTTVTVLGLVRDSDNRISGVTVPLWLNSVDPGETRELSVRFGPTVHYIANPKDLIDTADSVTVDFTFQPWPAVINPGCSPVMEWNR